MAACSGWWRWLSMLMVAWCASGAEAQVNCFTGAMLPMDEPFIGRGSVRGLLPVVSNGSIAALSIDTDGDANSAPDAVFALPIEARDAAEYFLSPSRQFVLALACPNIPAICGPSAPGRQAVSIAILSVPAPGPGAELMTLHTDCLASGVLNGAGRWYEAGLCNVDVPNINAGRTCTSPVAIGTTGCNRLFMARTSDDQGNAVLCWYDLNNATPSTIDGRARTTLRLGVNDPDARIDAGGNAYFIRHNINAGIPNNLYSVAIVDVCPGSANFGRNLTSGDSVLNNLSAADPIVNCVVSACATTSVSLVVQRPTINGDQFVRSVSVARCCAGAPPMGRCCSSINGTCDVTTLANCPPSVGAWTQGGNCSTSCPPVLTLAASGPSSAQVATPATYTFTATNAGVTTASNVRIEMSIPTSLVSFVSATSGGALNFGQLVWTIPTLAGGASAPVSVTVQPLCIASAQPFEIRARVNAGNAPILVTSAPIISVTTAPLNSTPLTGSITSSLSSGPPCFPGDTVTYTVTLTNTLAETRPGVRFSVSGTQNTLVDQGIDPGPGSFTSLFPFTWSGTLPPSSTSVITFRARVVDCPANGSDFGLVAAQNQLQITNTCSLVLASLSLPAPAAVGQTAVLELSAANGSPFVFAFGAGAARVRATIRNPRSIAQALGGAIVLDGSSFLVNDPPFAGPAPAPGFSWSSASRTLSYAGALGAGASASCEFDVALDPTVRCSASMTLRGGAGTCTNLSTPVELIRLNPPPAEPHVVGLDYIDGLWTLRPGIDTSPVPLWCFNFHGSGSGALARGLGGDLFLASPFIRFNPSTLEAQPLAPSTTGTPGETPRDIEFFAPTNSLYRTLSDRVDRYDLGSQTSTLVVQSAPGDFMSGPLAIGGDGRVATRVSGSNGNGLVIIDPRPPATLPLARGAYMSVTLPAPMFANGETGANPNPLALTVDAGGDYVVLVQYQVPSGGFATSLAKVNHLTLSAQVIVPAISGPAAIGPVTTEFIPATSMAVASDGSVILSMVVSGRTSRLSFNPLGYEVLANTSPGGLDMFASPVGTLGTSAPPCLPEFNGDGALNSDDLGDFITCYFDTPPCARADFNHDGHVDADDLGDYITAYFAGCP